MKGLALKTGEATVDLARECSYGGVQESYIKSSAGGLVNINILRFVGSF